jgi:hypothetical protein
VAQDAAERRTTESPYHSAVSIPRMRPTFDRLLPWSPEDVRGRICRHLERDDCSAVHQVAGNHLTITVPRSVRHFWSPWLWIEITADEENPGESRLFARFSPHPSVWTGVMLCQLSLIVIASLAAMFALAQVTIDQAPTALWVVPIALALAAGVYWMSLIGQRLAHEQMVLLHGHVDAALRDATPDATPTTT